jgi:transcriptional regulator with XRE-family HTH domain
MLTPEQVGELMATPIGPTGNRVAQAIELTGLIQIDVAAGTGLIQPYVSDVARGRHKTITIENAYKFAEFFGAPLEVLFPRIEHVGDSVALAGAASSGNSTANPESAR